ncbi:hypothetical protein GS582_14485 [Rhodococcus hoagii]|nr:hypothetical protein [Prescottella equi]
MAAPFLNGIEGRPIRAGFPTTTRDEPGVVRHGLPSGRHGITGLLSDVAEAGGTFNWLRWQRVGDHRDLLAQVMPERIQPSPTVFERATAADVIATTVLCPASSPAADSPVPPCAAAASSAPSRTATCCTRRCTPRRRESGPWSTAT